ncbi:hypothetical protein JHK87_006304 [Glycine soja]|nr:hypothetical protein JHK87_006304 [Glycine soja]
MVQELHVNVFKLLVEIKAQRNTLLLRVDLTANETQKVFDRILTKLGHTAPPVLGFRMQKGVYTFCVHSPTQNIDKPPPKCISPSSPSADRHRSRFTASRSFSFRGRHRFPLCEEVEEEKFHQEVVEAAAYENRHRGGLPAWRKRNWRQSGSAPR